VAVGAVIGDELPEDEVDDVLFEADLGLGL